MPLCDRGCVVTKAELDDGHDKICPFRIVSCGGACAWKDHLYKLNLHRSKCLDYVTRKHAEVPLLRLGLPAVDDADCRSLIAAGSEGSRTQVET